MILLIDNFDSFVYNVYQLVGKINPDIKVVRNDEIQIEDIKEMNPTHIIISQGPGYPKTAGISIDAVKTFAGQIPIMGICLGHQAIVEAFGGTISHAPELVHGKKRSVKILKDDDNTHTLCPLFQDLNDIIEVARYHSLSAQPETMPSELIVTAISPDQTIMGVMHKQYPVYGIQFHPESILTDDGYPIMKRFLDTTI